jgi:hypothetical protein
MQAENDWLRWQHQLIAELCKGFDWFRHHKLHSLLPDPELMLVDSEQLTPASLQQQLSNCLATEDETQLLRQLSTLPDVQMQASLDAIADLSLDGSKPLQERSNSSTPSANSSHSSCPAATNSSQQPIAPPDDPLYLFQHVFSKPPPACCDGLESHTLQDLRAHYKAVVRDLSLYLMQHQTGGMAAQDQPLDKIQAALIDHLRYMAEQCIAQGSLVTAFQLVSDMPFVSSLSSASCQSHMLLQEVTCGSTALPCCCAFHLQQCTQLLFWGEVPGALHSYVGTVLGRKLFASCVASWMADAACCWWRRCCCCCRCAEQL